MKIFNLKEKYDYYMKLAFNAYYNRDMKNCRKYYIKALEKEAQSIYQYNEYNSKKGIKVPFEVAPNPSHTYDCCIKSGWNVSFGNSKWFKDNRSKKFLVDKEFKK